MFACEHDFLGDRSCTLIDVTAHEISCMKNYNSRSLGMHYGLINGKLWKKLNLAFANLYQQNQTTFEYFKGRQDSEETFADIFCWNPQTFLPNPQTYLVRKIIFAKKWRGSNLGKFIPAEKKNEGGDSGRSNVGKLLTASLIFFRESDDYLNCSRKKDFIYRHETKTFHFFQTQTRESLFLQSFLLCFNRTKVCSCDFLWKKSQPRKFLSFCNLWTGNSKLK